MGTYQQMLIESLEPNEYKRPQLPVTSGQVRDIVQLMDTGVKSYETSVEEVKRLEELTQDYLHKLELQNLNYHERADVATRLSDCRKERRYNKDLVECLNPLVEFLRTKEADTFLKKLNQVAGKMRKIELSKEKRCYRPRILNEPNIVNNPDNPVQENNVDQ